MLVSLHYNMSSGHDLYGTECWTSAFGTSYAAGQSFGRLWLKDMTAQYGLHSRGTKVKLGSRGTDYYGVIREAHNRGIPGQSFGRLWLKDMTAQYGLHSRGTKVKLGSRGTDYYGVIREAHNRGIPCVILEHCYLDSP